MLRRFVFLTALAIVSHVSAPESQAVDPAKPPRMNLVFIVADDLRWNTLGFMGDKIVQTPNLDALAKRGIVFDNTFVTTSICAVSRATMLTGQFVRRHGINDFGTSLTPAQWAETYPALLRKAGYRTGMFGKYGVGKVPPADKFDTWDAFCDQGVFFKKGETQHTTAKLGDGAVKFVEAGKDGKPFCLTLWFNAPHARDGKPREFPPDARDEGLYTTAQIPVPKTATEEFFKKLPEFAQNSEGHRRWALRFDTPEKFQQITRDYYRLITGIDREVGRLVAALREAGVADHTLIVFSSDNGFFLGERGMADKWLPYEESIRLPLLVVDPRAPEARKGTRSDAFALNVDFAPTLLAYAGVKIPAGMQGRSLRPLVRGETPADWRKEIFYEHHAIEKIVPPSEAVRTERWKYLAWTSAKPELEELYDLKADPLEEKNLAGDAANKAVLEGLRAKRQKWLEQLK